jgi:hypothetical protein
MCLPRTAERLTHKPAVNGAHAVARRGVANYEAAT